MQFETIIMQKVEGVAKITMNRPEVLNAFNHRMSAELKEAVRDIAADENVRVVVITGAGNAFMSGADISMLQGYTEMSSEKVREIFENSFTPTMLENLPQPVIAAVNGYAFGMGCEIALGCDLRIASENARFGQPEIRLGIITGAGGSVRLTRLVGKTKSAEMILTGKPIDAKEAYRIGLVNQVVPAETLESATNKMVEELKSKGGVALKLSKASMNKAMERSTQDALAHELSLFYKVITTKDAKEGVSAFLEKRKPQFKGH